MKKLFFLIMVAIIAFTSCVTDDPYIPPTGEGGDVVLNEIMSKDPVSDLDFIELYNKGTEDVDISGYLINDAADPTGGFVIPDGTIIKAGEYYLVSQPELTVSISSGGEDVSLGEPDGTLLDLVFCPTSQNDGTTFSRIPDGGEVWVNGTEATPGAANIGDATTPSISLDYNITPTAGETVEIKISYASSETVSEVAVFYATGDAPVYDANNKLTGTLADGTATVTMTGLNVDGEKVSFFVAVTLDNNDVYYYDKDNKNVELSALTSDVTLWNTYTATSGVPAPTLALTFSATPTEGYEAVALEYASELEIVEARIYFAAGDAPEYIKNNKAKGEDEASFTQTGVTISMANLDVEDADGNIVGNTSDAGVKISFYVRLALANGTEYYYDKDGNVIEDNTNIDTDDAASDAFKADPTKWNTYTNKAPASLSTLTYPATPAATDDINIVLAYASSEEIIEARVYFAGSEGLYVKNNKAKGEDDASFTQTSVTINLKDYDVEKVDGTLDGTTSTSGATIKFYVRIATATSEYYYSIDNDAIKLMAVDDSLADGAFDSSDAFKDDASLWLSYTVQ